MGYFVWGKFRHALYLHHYAVALFAAWLPAYSSQFDKVERGLVATCVFLRHEKKFALEAGGK